MLGLIVVAPEFVDVVLLGDAGAAAIPLDAPARLGRAPAVAPGPELEHPPGPRPHRDAPRYAVVVAVATVVSFVLGVHWGVVGVAAAYAIASTIVEPYYTWLTARAIDVSLREISGLRSAGVAQAAGAMAVVVLAPARSSSSRASRTQCASSC